jgi:ABC-2 type transport system permease protein
MILKYLIEKEFKQFMRNPLLPKFIFIFPFVMLGLLPLAANFEVKDVDLSIVDNSHSPLSNRLIHKLESSGYFRISDMSTGYRQSIKQLEQNKSDVIVEIPATFETDLYREQASDIMITANTVDAMKGALSSAYLMGMIAEFNAEFRTELAPAAKKTPIGFSISSLFWFNPRLKYAYAMVPAIMVMLISIICGFLPAFNIVLEKEQGTIEQMNVTPVDKFSLILSKLIPYWVTGFIVLNMCFLVAWLFYGMVPKGSILTIYLFETVYVLAMSGLGLVISNYAKTLQQSMFLVFFIIITFIFLGGLYTPVDNMPVWAQWLSDVDPIKYFVRVMRLIYLKGSAAADMLPLLLHIVLFALVFNTWAILSYKKKS